MEQLTEVKQSKLKKMSSDRIKKHLVKVGYDEDELEQMSRSELMNTLANEWLKEIKVENISSSSEEEEGAVGGAKAEVKITSPMSMEMFLQWMMMEKQERKEQEEQRRREKEEQREKEEKKEEERRREKEEQREKEEKKEEERRREK